MSRHELAAHPNRPEVSHAVIGWDRPLATYFVQVFSKGSRGKMLFWQGTAPGEIPTADAAIALVEPFTVIPDDLSARLRRDFAEQPIRPPSHPLVGRRVRIRREGQPDVEGTIVQSNLVGFFARLDIPAPGKGANTILVFPGEIELLDR